MAHCFVAWFDRDGNGGDWRATQSTPSPSALADGREDVDWDGAGIQNPGTIFEFTRDNGLPFE